MRADPADMVTPEYGHDVRVVLEISLTELCAPATTRTYGSHPSRQGSAT